MIESDTNVIHKKVYDGPVQIEKINGKMYLNDVEIKENTKVSSPGDYTLKIVGEGEYEEVIEFSISNKVNTYLLAIGLPMALIFASFIVVILVRRRKVI